MCNCFQIGRRPLGRQGAAAESTGSALPPTAANQLSSRGLPAILARFQILVSCRWYRMPSQTVQGFRAIAAGLWPLLRPWWPLMANYCAGFTSHTHISYFQCCMRTFVASTKPILLILLTSNHFLYFACQLLESKSWIAVAWCLAIRKI